MKVISAAIIVFSGMALVAVGVFVGHDDTSFMVMSAGGIVGVAGLVGWWNAMNRSE